MSSRKSIQQVVSSTEPVGGSLGDEWLNPTTGVLKKLTLVNGVVQYLDVVTTNYSILQPVANVKFLEGAKRDSDWSTWSGGNIPVRHPQGYLYSNYFNTPADKTVTTPSHIAVQTNSDDYIRWQTQTQFKSNLGIVDPVTLAASLRANVNINGGGTITVDTGSNVLWSTRFIVISNSRGTTFSTNGYFDITCPTSGTITGVGGAGNQTATASGIPLPDWHALYYILPIGSNNVSIAANFRIVNFTVDVDIPYNWVLICVKNPESGYFYFPNGVNLKVGQNSTNIYPNGGGLNITATGANTTSILSANIADNDYFRILVGGTAGNAGYAEIATADDGTEPIYVRQYTGAFTSLTRTATILDGSGNTSFPGTVTATGFSGPLTGNASTATSAGSVTNSITFNTAGSGDASGTTYNGSAARTISYNTVGAPAYAQVAGSNFDFNTVFPATTTLNRVVWNTGDGNMLNSPNGNSTGVLLASQGSHALWNAQMFFEQGSAGSMFIRGSDDASGTRSWGAWKKIVSSTNYTDYTVTKTGTGASGTWGISITGNAANVTGTVAVANGGTGVTSSTGTGSVVLSASPTFTGTINAASLTLSGDLIVNGTTTTINSTTITVDDINIELGSIASPTDTTAAGGGITLKGATDKTISWSATNGWTSSETFNIVTGKTYKINGTDVLSATTLGSGVTGSSLTSVGTITSGTWSGSFGAVSGANLTSLTAGNLSGTIPSAVLGNSTVNIGTTAVALNRASSNLALTGISSVALPGATSGTITLTPAAVAGTTAITIPATAGTLALQGDTQYIGTTAVTLNRASANLALTGISSIAGVTSVTFAAEASDAASISTTISSTSTFFDFNLADDNNNDWWRWRFTPSGSTVYDAMTLKPSANGVSDLVVAGTITGTRLISNVAQGTAPLTVTSTTLVTNLNADLLDGNDSTYFTNASNLASGTVAAARMPALTGDVTTTAGAVATTLATVNSNVGSFGSASSIPVITVNAKGLITAVSTSAVSIPSGSISVTGGDLTMSGTTGTAITNATLATVNSNVGSFGSATSVPVLTVNAKGLITAVSTATVGSIPSQTGNAGKYLTTDGTTASWSAPTAAAGGGIYINNSTINMSYTIPTGQNGFSVGPITVTNGNSISVSSGQRWVIL